jgi:hypothetical protein
MQVSVTEHAKPEIEKKSRIERYRDHNQCLHYIEQIPGLQEKLHTNLPVNGNK